MEIATMTNEQGDVYQHHLPKKTETMVMAREGSGARFVPPSGFTFDPTDQDLISAYLDSYANGRPFENEWMFHHDDVYRTEPWNLLAAAEEKAYFITSRRTKGGNIDRTAGRGSWKMQGGKNIDSNPVGHRNQLTFHIDKQRKTTGWVMHEYVLGPKDRKNANLQPIALCRIVRKARAVVPDVQARDEGVDRKRSCAPEDPTTSHPLVRRWVLDEGCVMSPSSVDQWAYSAEDPSTSHAPLRCRVIGDGTAMPHDCFASPSCIEKPTYNSWIPADQPVAHVHFEPVDFDMINGNIQFYERQDCFASPSCIEQPTYNSWMPADQAVAHVHFEPVDFHMINGNIQFFERQDCFASPSCIEQPTYNSWIPADQPVAHVHFEPVDFDMINGNIQFYEGQDEFISGLNEQLHFLNAETDRNILDVVQSSTGQNVNLVTDIEAPTHIVNAVGPSTRQNIDADGPDCLVTEIEELIQTDDIIAQLQRESRNQQQEINKSSDEQPIYSASSTNFVESVPSDQPLADVHFELRGYEMIDTDMDAVSRF